MKTVSQATEEVLSRAPFFLEALSEGIANNAQIARKIRPAVEELLYEEVSDASVAMAVHRFAKQTKKKIYGAGFLKKLHDVTVRSNLVEFIFENSTDSSRLLEAIVKNARGKTNSFLNFSRGSSESILIVSSDLEEYALNALKNVQGFRVQKGLSAITMRLPEESLAVPGVYYPILKAIAQEGINLIEVMSVLTEFSIILEDKDINHAFSVLKRVTS
ncbi:MAG: hypothetical protein NT019_03010 [Candidatus Adlerbacteria bacterium]|nr:hypothetical protein [Candidatus Adlerbacteria bacterium]